MAGQPEFAGRRRLSVAIIARNEETVLRQTLDSVRSITDEIHVLDTGSTDATVEVAKAGGARVATVPWNDDFSAARNLLLAEINADWTLWLDAGERLASDTAAALREFVDHQSEDGKVYTMMVVAPAAASDASDEQIAQIRLLPNHPDLLYEGRVRETLEPAIRAAGLQVDMAPGRIQRHPRENDPARKTEKARRNLELIALESRGEAASPVRLLLAMGDALSDLNEAAKARQTYREAIRSAEPASTQMLEAYYGLLTTYDGDATLGDEQLSAGLEALEVFPLDAQLLCAMGSYLQNQRRFDLARRAFETAVRYGQVNLETWHLAEIAEMASICLGLCLQLDGNDEAAREVLEEAIGRFRESRRVRRHLIDLLAKLAKPDEAVTLIDGMIERSEQREPWRNAVLGACKAADKDWVHALGYLQSAYIGGCHDPFCLRWLVVTLMSNNQTAAARPVLEEWLQREPSSVEAQAYFEALGPQGPSQATAAEARPPSAASGPPQTADQRQIRIDPGSFAPTIATPQLPNLEAFLPGESAGSSES